MSQDTKPSLRQHQVVSKGNVRQHQMLPQDNPMVGPKTFCKATWSVTLGQIDIPPPRPQEPIFSSLLVLLTFNDVPSTTRSSPIRRVGESNPNLPLFSFPCHHGGPGTRPALNKMNSPKVACYETLAANLLLALAFKVEMLWGTQKGANVLYPYIVGWCEVHYIPNQLKLLVSKKKVEDKVLFYHSVISKIWQLFF